MSKKTTASPSNPEGIVIGKRWRIGRKLGSGACGSVHVIEKLNLADATSMATEYAVKVAVLPPPAAKGGKKRKKTAAERNADTLNYENTLYGSVLNDMRGKMIPDIPPYGSSSKVPPVYGESDGFRYLVMERMAAPLFEAVPLLHMNNPVLLGEIGIAMVECTEALHEHRYVFVDMKPENFMLSKANNKGGTAVASRVRLIDFGLAETFHDMSLYGHREDNGGDFAGTPMYASLNVLRGHTPSRRDDLEALAYILAEMLLMVVEHRNPCDEDVLPWSGCGSDDEILRVKENQVECDSGNSEFYNRMRAGGNDEACDVMSECLTFIRGIGYDTKPDYEHLKNLMKKLCVCPGVGIGTPSSKSTSKKTSNVAKKKGPSVVNPVKKITKVTTTGKPASKISKKIQPRVKKTASKTITQEYIESLPTTRRSKRITPTVNLCESDSDDSVASSFSSSPSIDVTEIQDDENSDPSHASQPLKKKEKKSSGSKTTAAVKSKLKMLYTAGPQQGGSFNLGEKVVVVGRDPSVKRGKHENVAVPEDEDLSSAHASFTLHSTKRGALNSVRVIDLKSTNGTFVNGKKLPSGGHRQAFVGDRIQLGETIIQIKKMSIK